MADPRYRALLIGNSTFPADANNLQTLEGPVNDVALLRGALTDRVAGLFDADSVRMLPERTSGEILVELEQFFGAAKRDDVLLLYYSGHGVLNERGQLFLCARDTRTDLLKSTSVSSMAVNMMFDESAARTTIIVLDCCHSGAFKGGSFPDALRGSGRFLLTSCRSGQLANDADRRNRTSLFTQHLVEGITGGASDGDADGYVEVGELFDYVSERLRAEGRQIPQRSFSGDGDVAIARRGAGAGTGAGAVATKGGPVLAKPDAVHTDLDFGRLVVGQPSARLKVRLAGDLSVASVPPWINVEEEPDGVAVTIDTWEAGRLSGEVVLRGTDRDARITVRAVVERPPEVVPPPARGPAPAPPPPSQPKPAGRTAAVVAAVVVVLVAVAALLVSRGSGDGGSASDTTAATVPGTTAPAGPKSVVLPGTVLWTDTGVDVRAGQTLEVTATGVVNTAVDIPNRSSPPDGIAGEENSENNVVGGTRHAAVIGRIGTNGQPFLVGSSLRRAAPATGRLYLGINDKGVANNSGQFDAKVAVSG
ncbi:MAG: caspase family protein [Acidimicrobiales bacterium]